MLNRLYGWYGKRVVRGVFAALVLLVCVGVISHFSGSDETGADISVLPRSVTLATVRDLGATGNFSVVGTVRAVSEAKLETEAGGRITGVSVGVGDVVTAGTVLATIENNSERAALLQAEGAYESARVAAEGSEASLDEAKVSARNTYRDAFSTVDGIVHNLVDDFFTNPTPSTYGFKLEGGDDRQAIKETRLSIEKMLTEWSGEVIEPVSSMNETDMLTTAEKNVKTVSDFISLLGPIVADEDESSTFTEAELASYRTRLDGARASLDGTLAAISGVRRTLTAAELSAENGGVSQSSALLKSALGTLRSAQANYEKTLVRTPIRGVVNALYLREGEYAVPGQPAAIVANNGSLEIATALGEVDVESVAVGDPVTVGESTAGRVTRVAPAVDPITGKSEVLISVEDTGVLKNGSTVTVTFRRANETGTSARILVPLSALKFLPQGPVAFGVDENGALTLYPVTVGPVVGGAVEVLEGLDPDSRIVTDARGLKEGDQVTVTNP